MEREGNISSYGQAIIFECDFIGKIIPEILKARTQSSLAAGQFAL